LFSNSQIDIETLPKVEALELKPIAKKYFTIIVINLVILYGIIIAVLSAVKYFTKKEGFHTVFWYLLAGVLIVFLAQLILYKLGFKKRKYALREKDITYSHGYLNNSTTTLPFNRIQHLEISRSFLARKFGLSTLKIFSAGESGGDLSIKGLPREVADSQYAFLTNILNERE